VHVLECKVLLCQLTRLLEPYLGGNSKTLVRVVQYCIRSPMKFGVDQFFLGTHQMFVNVSPHSRDMSETLSSLRFAEQVRFNRGFLCRCCRSDFKRFRLQVGSCALGKLSKVTK
jgi:hypothetical protein